MRSESDYANAIDYTMLIQKEREDNTGALLNKVLPIEIIKLSAML